MSVIKSEMLADSTVTVSGLTSPAGHPNHPSPFLLPPPRALMMNPAAYLAAPFLYGNSALSYAREFHARLKELQDSKVAAAAALVNSSKGTQPSNRQDHNGNDQSGLRRSPSTPQEQPIISITSTHSRSTFGGKIPAKKRSSPGKQDPQIKMDSNGALNLASSPSPTDFSQADTSGQMHHQMSSPRRSPNSHVGARSGQSFGVEMCVVCGDRASGRHYGAISCEGCKGFFKRSIRKQLGYQCRGNRDCEVTKHHRNRCQYCRLQKCLAMGMRSDSVQSERRPGPLPTSTVGPNSSVPSTFERPPTFNKSSNSALVIGSANIYSDSPTMLPRTPLAPETLLNLSDPKDDDTSTDAGSSNGDHVIGTSGLVDPSNVLAAREKSLISRAMDHLARTIASESNESETDSEPDEEIVLINGNILTNMMVNFRLATPSPLPAYLNAHFICETASRLLFLSVHWVRSIPAFSALGYDTQVGLVRNAWSDIFVLGMAQCATAMNLQSILATLVSHLQASVSQEKLTAQRVRQVTSTICKVQEFVRAAAKMEVDTHEFAYLKIISLFTSDHAGIVSPKQVAVYQEKAVKELRQYCGIAGDEKSETRFSRLLLSLSPLRSIQPDVLEELFFAGLIGNVQIDSVVPYILKMESSEYQNQFGAGCSTDHKPDQESGMTQIDDGGSADS